MFTIQYTDDDMGRAVAMAMLPCPDSVVPAGRKKKKSTLSHVLEREE